MRKLFSLRALLLLVLLIGTFLRFYNIDHRMRFIWDEGRDMLAIRHMLMNIDLTLFGPFNEIDGKKDFFGVFHYYLMAPGLYLFNYDPVGPALFTAALGVISILVCFLLIQTWSNQTAALAGTALYAVSPLLVKYSQWPWNPNTTGFFSLLYLVSLTQLYRTRKIKWSGIAGLLLGLLFQLHYFTLALGVMWLFALYLKRNAKLSRHWIGFIASFILPNLTFVVFDLTHDHFYWKILTASFMSSGAQKLFIFKPLSQLLAFWQVTLNLMTSLLGNNWILGSIGSLLFWVLTIYSWLAFKQTKRVNLTMICSSVWLVYCLMISFFPGIGDDYHAIPYALLMIYPLADSARGVLENKAFKRIGYGLLGLLLVFLIYSNHPFRPPTWEENMPVIREAGQVIASDAGDASFNLASLIDADTRAVRFRYFLDVWGKTPMGVEEYPTATRLYIIVRNLDNDFRHNPAWELSSFSAVTPVFVGTAGEYQIWKIDKLTKS